ncbi:MAG: hypothetical protein R2880_06950 [Deinococcales bacterium]
MRIFWQIPTLIYPLIAYIVLALTQGINLNQILFEIPLMSGGRFMLSVQDLLLALGIFFLTVEIIKATRSGNSSIIDHMFSMIVFVIYLLAFVMYAPCGTSSFLLLTLMALADVIAGFSVTISSARRDFTMDRS